MHTHILMGDELLMRLDHPLPAVTEGRHILIDDTRYAVLSVTLNLNRYPHVMEVYVYDVSTT